MKKNTVVWADCIRVAAIFFVVLLHSAAPLLNKYNTLSQLDWWAGNIYDSLARVCVPLLFILSGYLLLGKQEPPVVYLKKRVKKILVPLIAWSIFYILWKHYYENSEPVSFQSFYSILYSPAYVHLWFFYALIGLYLFIPILRILVQHASREILFYFVALWFIAVSAIPAIQRATHITSSIDLQMISGYVGYVVIGQLLGNARIDKRQFQRALFVALVCAVITMAGTFFLTARHNGILDQYFYGYLSPNVILLSVSAFVMLKYVSERILLSEKQQAILASVSSASFGIYLIHPMVRSVIRSGWLGFSFSVFSTSALCSVPLMALLTFGISLAVTLLLQKIPFIRKCVP